MNGVTNTYATIWLFGKPRWMLGDELTPERIAELAEFMHEHLQEISMVMEILEGAGWETELTLYDITLHKDISYDDAVAEIEGLGIDLDDGVIELDSQGYESDDEDDDDYIPVDVVDKWWDDVDLGIGR